MSLTLFQGKGFTGKSCSLMTSAHDLWAQGFNDQASSVRVHEGTWELYRHVEYEGNRAKVGPGDYDMDFLATNVGNDAISSVKILDGLTLYTKGNWTGESLTISESKPTLGLFDDRTSSLIIHNGTWMAYELADYKGASCKLHPDKYDADYLINKFGCDNCISSLKKMAD